MKTELRGRTVATLDREDRVSVDADVLIENDRIARGGRRITDADGPFDRVIDASRRLVMPRLVDAHFHRISAMLSSTCCRLSFLSDWKVW